MTADECKLIGGVVYCRCGRPSQHYRLIGASNTHEVKQEAPTPDPRVTDDEQGMLYRYCQRDPAIYAIVRRLVTYGMFPDPPTVFDVPAISQKAFQSTSAVLRRRYKNLRINEGYNEEFCRVFKRAADELERLNELLDQAPIAKVIVSEENTAQVVLYAPGLPLGEHDVYLIPEPPAEKGPKS